ncbi:hypothetical protein HHI36_019766, partial [Cryptolaemus montrouzieri]
MRLKRPRYKVDKLKNRKECNPFKEEIKRKTRTENIQDWESLAKVLTETAEDILGTVDGKRKEWISDETWNLINKRKRIKGETLTAHTMETKAEAQGLYQKMNKR